MAFFRIEQEDAKFVLNEKEEHPLHDGDAVVIPVGTYHNVVNTSKRAMLTIYSPPKHPGRDSKQDQSRDGSCGSRGTPLKRAVVSVKVARVSDRTRT
jgi:hypothetical protein